MLVQAPFWGKTQGADEEWKLSAPPPTAVCSRWELKIFSDSKLLKKRARDPILARRRWQNRVESGCKIAHNKPEEVSEQNMADVAQAISLRSLAHERYWKRPLTWEITVVAALLAWLYGPTLVRLVQQWWSDPNFSHGFFVPLFSAYVLWQNRSVLVETPRRPSLWGLAVIIFSLCLLLVGVLGAEIFLARSSLILLLAGMVIFFAGWKMLRAVLFPLAFLALMVPIPSLIFNQITFPLQIFASKVAAWALPLFGVPVLREGNIINLPAMPLEVAEACSGIRSLLSLTTLSIMYGYLLEKRVSIRVVLALASIPIAVTANSFRIIGTGLLVQYWDPDKAEGFFHAFSGWLIFVSSLMMLFLLHRGLKLLSRESGVAA
jgi:exosortase